jgi:hypothetical protein
MPLTVRESVVSPPSSSLTVCCALPDGRASATVTCLAVSKPLKVTVNVEKAKTGHPARVYFVGIEKKSDL